MDSEQQQISSSDDESESGYEERKKRETSKFNNKTDYKSFCRRFAHLQKNRECHVINRNSLKCHTINPRVKKGFRLISYQNYSIWSHFELFFKLILTSISDKR